MKTYNPVVDLVNVAWWMAKMEEDANGEWMFLEDHLATVAENALQLKKRDVEIDKLKSFVNQFIDLSRIPSDATHFSILDGCFFYKKEGDEWVVYITGTWHPSKLFKDGKLHQSDLISVEMLRV